MNHKNPASDKVKTFPHPTQNGDPSINRRLKKLLITAAMLGALAAAAFLLDQTLEKFKEDVHLQAINAANEAVNAGLEKSGATDLRAQVKYYQRQIKDLKALIQEAHDTIRKIEGIGPLQQKKKGSAS